MITFFTIPKSFIGHSAVIQANAIRSWTKIKDSQVILFGNDRGVKELAEELGLIHYPDLGVNEFGTPLVSEAFSIASRIAVTKHLAYVNSDIIFVSPLENIFRDLDYLSNGWMLVGQRIDINISSILPFNEGWDSELRQLALSNGVLHGKAGIDYFIFPRKLEIQMPNFAVGRPGWDSWLIYNVRSKGFALIDGTKEIFILHQNHPPAYKSYNSEAQKNKSNAGGYYNMGTIRDANYKLVKSEMTYGIKKSWVGIFLFLPPVRFMLSFKRRFIEYLKK